MEFMFFVTEEIVSFFLWPLASFAILIAQMYKWDTDFFYIPEKFRIILWRIFLFLTFYQFD